MTTKAAALKKPVEPETPKATMSRREISTVIDGRSHSNELIQPKMYIT